ncbi:substrate-binding periplasmic protein [Paucibacter sp. Y2R2-4]|uniref:substrate-binding periplasmic protein n=1 Tax=Paucibacter sp. Y2R2-4 TaxID=2893553 RepID=UPI0021E4145D|nr:transporter substrate-binding domain-containing protein [Paucibacter sp. Y2R2-4]MCV2350494.1 transporter substrate-binding domain-containing protein [Paucibacter sp. Y2R2-4]
MAVPLHAGAAEAPVSLCFEDTMVYPWITGEARGLAFLELGLVEKELNLKFEYQRLPWRRCLLEVQLGRMHAAIAASYNKERAVWGSYPTLADGSLNRELRMHTDSFHVYRRVDSPVRWQQQRFENLGSQPVGVQLGYSVGKNIEELGYPIKSARSSDDLARMLTHGVLQVAVLQNFEAMRLLNASPSLRKLMVEEGAPVKVADQYLVFNTAFFEAKPALVKSIWAALEKARKSKTYLDEEALRLTHESRPR